jgi:PIN domain nuclease of toxin-antitoxin system
MPLFNLETSIPNLEKDFMKLLKTNSYQFSFSSVSIIEMKWIIIQLEKEGKDREELEKQFSESIGALRNDNRFNEISILDPVINDISYELTKLGHKDYFDTVIASSALWQADLFLTLDKELERKINLLIEKRTFSMLSAIPILNWFKFKETIRLNLN